MITRLSKIIVSILVLIMSVIYPINAQDFSIISAKTDSFPKVFVQIEMLHGSRADKKDFEVLDNGKSLSFELQRAGQGTNNYSRSDNQSRNEPQTICYLIEASGMTAGRASKEFKNAVAQSLNNLPAGTLANVCWFGKANRSGRALNMISAEFTTDNQILIRELNAKVFARQDSSYRSDVFKAIYECLDFMADKTNKNLPKKLIILSTGLNNSRSSMKVQDCIDKANSFEIPIFALTYQTSNRYASDNFVLMADKTKGQAASGKTQGEINSILSGFTQSGADNRANSSNNEPTPNNETTNQAGWEIVFKSEKPADGGLHSIEIAHKGLKLATTYTAQQNATNVSESNNKNLGNILKNNTIALIGFVLLIALILYFIWKKQSKKKEEEYAAQQKLAEDKIRELEAQKQALQAQKHESSPQFYQPQNFSPPPAVAKPDLNRTIISSGGFAPVLIVRTGQNQQTYRLEKTMVTIGRNPTNDLVLSDHTVSGNHAQISNQNGQFMISDLGSTNGTQINGTRITQQLLRGGDMINLGAMQLSFSLDQ